MEQCSVAWSRTGVQSEVTYQRRVGGCYMGGAKYNGIAVQGSEGKRG